MVKTEYEGVVGYIGLGDMGGGIASHLADTGVDLMVYDLDEEKMAKMRARGARSARSLKELVSAVDVIVICIDPESQVLRVVQDCSEHLRSGQTVIIQSSVSPAWIVDMAEAVAPMGVKLYDAPVSGTHKDRLEGTLAVLTGATSEAVAGERGLLESIGRPLYLGSLGGGQVAKLANNSVMTVARLATAEALAFGRAFGVSEESLTRAIQLSSGATWVLDNWQYFDDRLRSGITKRQSGKQSKEILDAAQGQQVRMRMTEAALEHASDVDESRYTHILGS